MKKCLACKIVVFLAALGSINWVLWASFGINIVTTVSNGSQFAERMLYALIGLSGVMLAGTLVRRCPMCVKIA